MNDFLGKFQKIGSERKDIQFPFDLNSSIKAYYGRTIDGKYRLSFLSSISTKISGDTTYISIVSGSDGANNYWTCFDLNDDSLLEPFCILADDLVSSVDGEFDEAIAVLKLKNRFNEWIKLLKKSYKHISEEEIRGLYGELYCIYDYIIPNYGYEKAIRGWGGPDNLSKDFSFDYTWIEVKTTGVNSDVVKISSIGQLESNQDGKLYVVKLEQKTIVDGEKNSSINKLVAAILDIIDDVEIKDIFLSKLSDKGFIPFNEKGDQNFEVHERLLYIVDKKFPILKLTDEQKETICNASYELILGKLNEFLEIKK